MMDGFVLLFAVTGLCAGSFVAAAAWRVPRSLSLWGRSACPECCHVLGAGELVPVVSWLWQRGRCRHCGAAIRARYPLVEGLTGLHWALCALLILDPSHALIIALLGSCLLFLALVDLDWRYLPDGVVLLVAMLAMARWPLGLADPWQSLAGMLLTGALALSVRAGVGRWLGREALGWGDVKLMAAAGLWLGIGSMPAFLFLSGLAGILHLGLARLVAGQDTDPELPFGVALSVALMILVLYPVSL